MHNWEPLRGGSHHGVAMLLFFGGGRMGLGSSGHHPVPMTRVQKVESSFLMCLGLSTWGNGEHLGRRLELITYFKWSCDLRQVIQLPRAWVSLLS